MKMQLLKAAAVALLQALAVCRAQENAAVGERAIKAVAVSQSGFKISALLHIDQTNS